MKVILGIFDLIFRRITFERKSFKKSLFREKSFKRMIFVEFECVNSKFKRIIFV